MFVELEYMTMPALHFEGQNGSADVKWSQMFLGRQGNPFCTRQEQKHETHRNPSALILMNLNDLHLESRRSHAHKCTAYTTCCLHWCESGWKRKARRTNMRNEIEMTGMSLLTTPDDLFLPHHFWPLSIHRSRDVPSVACEAMMKTSRTSPYSLKHSSSWALGSLCFRTHTVSENENFWTRGLSLLKNTRCIQHYSTFYMWCFRRLASL